MAQGAEIEVKIYTGKVYRPTLIRVEEVTIHPLNSPNLTVKLRSF